MAKSRCTTKRDFFTVTGRRIESASAHVESRQAALDQLYAEVFGAAASPLQPPPSPPRPAAALVSGGLSDDQILEKARRSRKSGTKFSALWAGAMERPLQLAE